MYTGIAHVTNHDCIPDSLIGTNRSMRISFIIFGIPANIAKNVFIDVIFLGINSSLPVLALLGSFIHAYLVSQDVSLFN